MALVAHAGHWLIYVLYAIPVVVVGASIVISLLRQRRARHARHSPESAES
jgi:hypothetical protein